MGKRDATLAATLLATGEAKRRAVLERMSERQKRSLRRYWQLWAHEGQLPPEGDWLAWLILAGRGFGKTRAGAEWVRARAEADPEARIALVGASLGEVRSVMVEGESGLLAIAPYGKKPKFEPSKRQLQWPGGGRAMLYSAGEAESLRGPQHSHACRADPEGRLSQRNRCQARCPAVSGHRGRAANPPPAPQDGQSWLIGQAASGDWLGHDGQIAIRQGGNWMFAVPVDGLRLLDRASGQEWRFSGGWRIPDRPDLPAGGTTIDAEARAAIVAIMAALETAGVIPAA